MLLNLYVESHFGSEMSKRVFAMPANEQNWQGPIMSDHGAHLVMVSQKQGGYMPTLTEVYSRVASEAQRAITAERAKQATQQIVDSYDIDVVYQKPKKELAKADY